MSVLNQGGRPTFEKGEQVSWLDITFVTQKLAANARRWEVLEDESLSDRKLIYFEVDTASDGNHIVRLGTIPSIVRNTFEW